MLVWRPPQRIRYQPGPGRIPTREEAAASRLFASIRVGPLELEQRTWVPAMVPWRATEEGFVTDEIIDWYARFARGRPGAIVVEATGIRDIPSGPLLRIGGILASEPAIDAAAFAALPLPDGIAPDRYHLYRRV